MPNIKIEPSLYEEIIDLHVKGQKPSSIASVYDVSEDTIRIILKKCHSYKSRTSRKHSINESFFAKIDTEKKAYFLGLLYADGNNSREGVRISLCEPDEYLIYLLKEELGASNNVKRLRKRKPHHKQKYSLDIYSSKISDDLSRLGCIPAKSLTLAFPDNTQVPDKLMSHFLRGYFDGDGTLGFVKKENKLNIQITSSKDFCEGLNLFLRQKFGFIGMTHRYSHSKAQDIRLTTRTGIVFLDFIYTDASIKMYRKFDKFISFLGHYSPKNVGGTSISVKDILDIRDKWLKFGV